MWIYNLLRANNSEIYCPYNCHEVENSGMFGQWRYRFEISLEMQEQPIDILVFSLISTFEITDMI